MPETKLEKISHAQHNFKPLTLSKIYMLQIRISKLDPPSYYS